MAGPSAPSGPYQRWPDKCGGTRFWRLPLTDTEGGLVGALFTEIRHRLAPGPLGTQYLAAQTPAARFGTQFWPTHPPPRWQRTPMMVGR